MKERTSKRFFWNTNADTHKNAICQFFILSTLMSSTSSLVCYLLVVMPSQPLERFELSIAIVTMFVCGVVMWFVVFSVMLTGYITLIESQVINPPTENGTVIQKRFYQTENGWKEAKTKQGRGVSE